MSPPDLPRRLGRFVLLEAIGKGGMGEAFLALSGSPTSPRLCVVKTGLPRLESHLRRKFEDEARLAARLSFSNLAAVYEVGHVDGRPFIAMEHVDGRSLEQVMQRSRERSLPVPTGVALFIARDLARALHYLHSRKDLSLIHRDVAPPNVLISWSGEVKLIDLGVAESAMKSDETLPGIVHGHLEYQAPERLNRTPFDHRADLFSAGVVLWELLVGRSLCPTEDLTPLRNAAIPPPSADRPELPSTLDELMRTALAADPAARFADGEAMRKAVAQQLAKIAPLTDVADVAAFMSTLFVEESAREARQRDELVRAALPLLSEDSAEATTTDVVPDPLIGSLLDGRYRVHRLRGEGASAKVYEATHVQIARPVAIKVLRSQTLSRDAVEGFAREARLASRAGDPHIVNVTDAGITSRGAPFFVMECLDGESLDQVLKREGRLDTQRALRIARDVALALESAHGSGVIHRDLKPSNVMLVRRGDDPEFVKVLDFGVGGTLEGKTTTGSTRDTRTRMSGTPLFMAPEQIEGGEYDARTDLYALGELLYVMLAGRVPWETTDTSRLLRAKLAGAHRTLREVREDTPAELDGLVQALLARAPEDRPRDAAQVILRLEGMVESHRRASRTQEIAGAPVARVSIRTRWLLAAFAAVLMGGVGLLAGRGARTSSGIGESSGGPPPSDRPASSAPRAARQGSLPTQVPEATGRTTEPSALPTPSSSGDMRTADQPPQVTRERALPHSTRGQAARPNERRTGPRESTRGTASALPTANAILSQAEEALAARDYARAVELGREALRLQGSDARTHLLLGRAHFMLTRYRSARDEFAAALKLAPGDAEAETGFRASQERLAK